MFHKTANKIENSVPLNFDIGVPRSDQIRHKQRSAFHKQNLKQRSAFHSILSLAFRVPTPLSISVPRSVIPPGQAPLAAVSEMVREVDPGNPEV